MARDSELMRSSVSPDVPQSIITFAFENIVNVKFIFDEDGQNTEVQN